MTGETRQNKIGRASLYFGLSAISLWIVIFLTQKMNVAPFLLVIFPAAIIVSVVGFILGIIGTVKKNVKKKYAIIGIIINAPVFLILLALVLYPIFVELTYVPDKKEINERFNEFLVNPSDIQGIEALQNEGYALFKYHTSNEDFFEQLEHQVSDKGWTKKSSKGSIVEFLRENHMKNDGEIYMFRYEHIKTFHNKESGLVCVGFNKIIEGRSMNFTTPL